MSVPVYLRVGNGAEHEVGTVTTVADSTGSDVCAGVALLLRQCADIRRALLGEENR